MESDQPTGVWTSERTLRYTWAHHAPDHARRASAWGQRLHAQLGDTLIDAVPGIRTLTLFIDPLIANEQEIERACDAIFSVPIEHDDAASRTIEIPVCFDSEFAPDLARVSQRSEDPILLFTSAEYRVALLGFAPGFAYLDGLPSALHTPRLDRPRPRIEPGSVAIAGDQAAIYPGPSPGGWNIIGRTPLVMFDPQHNPPAHLCAGDLVRFIAIDRTTYDAAQTHTA